jgi:hypothetical protein
MPDRSDEHGNDDQFPYHSIYPFKRLEEAMAFVCGETYRTSLFASRARPLNTFADQFG